MVPKSHRVATSLLSLTNAGLRVRLFERAAVRTLTQIIQSQKTPIPWIWQMPRLRGLGWIT